MLVQESVVRSSGLVCPNPECCSVLNEASIGVQIDTQIRTFIAKFYEGWVVCDDQSCLNRTRQLSVYGRRCLRPECRGTMHFEVCALLVMHSAFTANVCRTIESTPTRSCTTRFCTSTTSLIWITRRRKRQAQLNKVRPLDSLWRPSVAYHVSWQTMCMLWPFRTRLSSIRFGVQCRAIWTAAGGDTWGCRACSLSCGCLRKVVLYSLVSIPLVSTGSPFKTGLKVPILPRHPPTPLSMESPLRVIPSYNTIQQWSSLATSHNSSRWVAQWWRP